MRLSASRLLGSAAALLGVAALLLPRLQPALASGVALALFVGALLLAAMAVAYRGARATVCDAAPPAVNRRYQRELMTAMGGYVLVLFASVWLLRHVDGTVPRALIALAPVVPIGFSVRAMVRYMRALDEMQQRIELESVGVATVLVSMLYMTGGLLQSARLLQVSGEIAMIWVFPLVCAVYGIAKSFVARRYR